jgi:hypothetical protein
MGRLGTDSLSRLGTAHAHADAAADGILHAIVGITGGDCDADAELLTAQRRLEAAVAIVAKLREQRSVQS